MADKKPVSRRNMLKKAAAAVGGGTAASLLGGAGLAAQARGQAPAIATGTQAGRRYRAFMAFNNAPGTSIQAAKASVETVTMKPLDPDRVVVRTEAAQVCYTIVGQVVGNFTPPAILGHSAVGIVDTIGARVKRVQVGDRVILANTPQCGVCYNCLRGRADRCMNVALNPTVIGTLADGTDVVQQHDRGGFAELVIAPEAYCIPIFNNVPPVDLSMLGCSGACGLGTTIGVAPVEVGADVVVLGCGPLGLSAVQGAKIKGASQIIAVDPIADRRNAARQLGATSVIDPNVDTANIVANIRDLCKGPSTRTWAGGRLDAQKGPDFVIEAVGGDIFPPKAAVGPDPTGLMSLQWAWALCSSAGHVMTVAVGQRGNFTVPAGQWSNGAKNHHPGNFNGVSTLKDMQLFARLIETGQFNAKVLGPVSFPLDRTKDALQLVSYRTAVGAVIVF